MNEDDSEAQFATMAIHRQNGLSLGTSWSHVPFPNWNIQRNHNDIFFAWNSRMVKIHQEMHDANRQFVIAGFPGDVYLQREKEEAKLYRSDLEKKYRARYFLSLVDNRFANDLLISQDVLLEIYEKLFLWLEQDKENFLILKTKDAEMYKAIPILHEKMNAFVNQGRMALAKKKGVLYPGLASDVCFGMASISLTSLLASLNHPVIFYDNHHFFQEFPLNLSTACIISKPLEIIPAIENFMIKKTSEQRHEIPNTLNTPGDLDGKAPLRIKTYIEDLLTSYQKGFSTQEALTDANTHYQNTWGPDCIIAGTMGHSLLKEINAP